MFQITFQLGSITDWIQAVGNILVLIIAIITLLDQKKQIKKLKAKEEKRTQIEEKAQANLVSVWAEEWGRRHILGFCSNLSSEPIYNVIVFFDDINSQTKREIFLMKPHEELKFVMDIDVQEDLSIPKLGIKFQDASGRIWVRGINGKIISLSL